MNRLLLPSWNGHGLLVVAAAVLVAIVGSAQNSTNRMEGRIACEVREGEAPVTIGNRFSGVNYWHFFGTTNEERAWHEDAESMPERWVKEHYPWLEEVRLLTALGGSYLQYRGSVYDAMRCEFDRDLFKDPSDRTITDDYDFSPLIRACRNILRQGLRPIIKFHGVPIKLSSEPHIGSFRVNVRPPDSFDEYARYMEGCVKGLIDAFGIGEVRTWRWITATEMNNREMFETANGDPESTKAAYFRIYDTAFEILTRLLGKDHVEIASHGYEEGFWNELDFLEYAFSDAEPVSHLNKGGMTFYSTSYYNGSVPRNPNDLSSFDEKIGKIRSKLKSLGKPDLPIEIGEGGLGFGWDREWLWHGLCLGGEFDLTWTAVSFKKLLDNNVRTWPRWPNQRTYGLFSGIETLSTHLLRLIYRMRNDERLDFRLPGSPAIEGQIVDGVAGIDRGAGAMHLLLFNHKADLSEPRKSAPISLRIQNLLGSEKIQVRAWHLDREHGDFWHRWEQDRQERGLTRGDYRPDRSMDQIYVQNALRRAKDIDFWYSKESKYKELARFPDARIQSFRIAEGAILLEMDVDCFAAVFLEISRI